MIKKHKTSTDLLTEQKEKRHWISTDVGINPAKKREELRTEKLQRRPGNF